MSLLLHYLETYTPETEQEQQFIAILQRYHGIFVEIQQIKQVFNQGAGEQNQLDLRLKKLEKLELRKVHTELLAQVFEKLNLSHPKQYKDNPIYLFTFAIVIHASKNMKALKI
ncbi:MAG: hypothetical protein HC796_02730 [Synechococcaceae cyanobacterium RL_1_2]|nr:hypothetical protein [Synechococcaceae cyanobacterium RL_1_2]